MLDRSASRLGCLPLLWLAASCTTPDVAPAADAAAPVVTQPESSTEEVVRAEVVRAKAPAKPPAEVEHPAGPSPAAPSPAAPVPTEPAPAEATPWGSPLQITGKSHGLRFTTTTQVERTATGLQLTFDVELHNSTRAPMKVSLHPPLVTVSTAPVPGSTGEGLGLRGEGLGSDVCSPGHGGPTTLPPDGRSTVTRTVELDPLPWPPGQAYRVTATTRDCRPSRLSLDVLDVLVLQPASPDGVPSLRPGSPAVARK